MKIAVAGATGRLGRHVADVLSERGHEVVPMSLRWRLIRRTISGSPATKPERSPASPERLDSELKASTMPPCDSIRIAWRAFQLRKPAEKVVDQLAFLRRHGVLPRWWTRAECKGALCRR